MPPLDPPTVILPPLVDRLAAVTEHALGGAPYRPATAAGALVFNQRLDAVLRGAVEGFACDRAELHLLDDATAELRLANAYAAGPRLAQPSRPASRLLEEADADVAAMAGAAVVLEDEESAVEWQTPCPAAAAVCAPVASDTTIHGTLWLYSRTERRFTDAELQLIEIIAGRLAVELERHELLSHAERGG